MFAKISVNVGEKKGKKQKRERESFLIWVPHQSSRAVEGQLMEIFSGVPCCGGDKNVSMSFTIFNITTCSL